MVRVMASGVFDILHVGHLHFLSEAKKLGDELFVVIATDNTVRKEKREPIMPQEHRQELIAALKPVDKAMLGDDKDMYAPVRRIKPDIVALGYDQDFDEKNLAKELKENKIKAKVVRLNHYDAELDATRKIIGKIVYMWSYQKDIEYLEAVSAKGKR